MSQRSPFNQRNMAGASREDSDGSAGMTRKSASKAKPARAAAQTVRVAPPSKKTAAPAKSAVPADLSKEERKARRRARRQEEDQVARVTELLMKRDPTYLRLRRVWWVLLAAGVVCILVSFGITSVLGSDSTSLDFSTSRGIISGVMLIVSYALIIAGLVWEFVKIRPLRNEVTAKVSNMSAKRRRAVIEEAYQEDEQRRAERKARKGVKK